MAGEAPGGNYCGEGGEQKRVWGQRKLRECDERATSLEMRGEK